MLALTFQVGHDRLALDIRHVSEVAPRVPLERPADSPPWLAGLLIYRGAVVPVVDLYRLLGAGECPWQLSSRIIVVPYEHRRQQGWLGLLAAQVIELQEIPTPTHPIEETLPGDQPNLGQMLNDGGRVLRLVDVDALLPTTVHDYLDRGSAA